MDVLHFQKDCSIYQRTIDEYKNHIITNITIQNTKVNAKVGGTGGLGDEEEGNNLIDMILLSDFYQSSMGNNNLTGMRYMIYII